MLIQDASVSSPPPLLLDQYAPFLVLVAMVFAFAIFAIVASTLLGGKRTTIGKGGAYECGMSVKGSSRLRLSIHFYLVAVLFILFDVESLLLIPWAVTAREFAVGNVGGVVLAEVTGFVAVLAVGLAYVWRKGGLTWDR